MDQTKSLTPAEEQELKRQAGIAARQLNYKSLRQFEFDIYRKVIEAANKKQPIVIQPRK